MNSDKILENKINIILNKLKVEKFDEVIAQSKTLIKKFKNQQILYNILSLAYQGKGEYEKSIELLSHALKSQPKNIFFLNNLGLSYYKNTEFEKAENLFKRALDINPNYINTLNNLAILKKDLDLVEDAIALYEKALSLNEDSIETNYNIAALHQTIGNYKKSIFYYNKILKLNPKFTKADFAIAMMSKYSENNEHFLNMKEKIKNDVLNENEKMELYFALGKAYEDINDYDTAFLNFKNANIFRKKITGYKIKSDINQFDQIKKKFSKNILKNLKANTKKIIFILGMPRSGTSLVEQIISNHKNVYGGGEVAFLERIISKNKILNEEFDSSKSKNKIFYDKLNEIQEYYISQINKRDSSSKIFTDKSPLNFKWIGFIQSIFPNSKIIHCNRNSIDTCWSIYKNNFDGSINFSNDLKDLGDYYNMYKDLMFFWENKYKNKIYNIYYENLISDQKNEIEKLINFCDIGWDPNCLEFHKNKKTIKTVSFAQARQPIYKTSIKASGNYTNHINILKDTLNY